MAAMNDSVRKHFLTISILFVIACAVYILVIYFSGIETEVMRDRFRNADAIFNGEVPVMEYPPFALVFMVIPRLFASTEFGYNVAYVAEVCVFMIIGLYFICKLAEKFNYDQKKAMLAYSILLLLMFEFVTDRYDIFPMVMTLISFYCFVTKRYAWAFALLSLGTLTKLYPAVLFPIYLMQFLVDRNWKEVLKGTGVFILAALAVVIPVMIVNTDMIVHFLEYHSDRPLQIESVAASLIYPFSMIGMTNVWIEYTFGSDNLIGHVPDAVASVLTYAMVISIILAYVAYAYLLKRSNRESAEEGQRMFLMGIVIVIVLLLFMVVGKVFSSQYLIWLVPPLVFMFMTSSDERFKHRMFILVAVCMIITQINFAYNVGYLGGGVNIDNLGMMIILIRNLLMVVITYFLVRSVYDVYKEITQTGAEETQCGNTLSFKE